MSFYNPYQQGPAVGQGMQDMISQIIQIMMMKKMMGGGQNQQQAPPTQMPMTGAPQPSGTPGGMPTGGQVMQNLPPGQMSNPRPMPQPPPSPPGSMPPGSPMTSGIGGGASGMPGGMSPEIMQMMPFIMELMKNPQMLQMIMGGSRGGGAPQFMG